MRGPLIQRAAELLHGALQRPVVAVLLSSAIYRLIIAVNVIIIVVGVVLAWRFHDMSYLYPEYLVDYQLGFIRRGLVPEVISIVTPRLSQFDVKLFATALLATTLIGFVAMHATRLGLKGRNLPLLAVAIASPGLFKNWVFDFGRLDAFGLLGGIVALSLPLNAAYPAIVAIVCIVLVFIHEAQFLTYVPAILLVAAIRLVGSRGSGYAISWREAGALLAILVAFGVVVRYGDADVAPDVFLAHLRSRALDPVIDRVFIWYTGPWQNMQAVAQPDYLWHQLRKAPSYLAILLVHVPLLACLRAMVRQAPAPLPLVVAIGLAVMMAGYLTMFAIGADRARFLANGIASVILVVYAVRLACGAGDRDVPFLGSPIAVAAAWAMTVMPRVGLMEPF